MFLLRPRIHHTQLRHHRCWNLGSFPIHLGWDLHWCFIIEEAVQVWHLGIHSYCQSIEYMAVLVARSIWTWLWPEWNAAGWRSHIEIGWFGILPDFMRKARPVYWLYTKCEGYNPPQDPRPLMHGLLDVWWNLGSPAKYQHFPGCKWWVNYFLN